MMEQTTFKKMARYIELSEKFSKREGDIFSELELRDSMVKNNYNDSCGSASGSYSIGGNSLNVNNIGIYLSGSVHIDGREIYVDENGNVKAKDEKKPLTRGQQLEATTILKSKVRGLLLDEYDEYMKLRTSLKDYFSGVDKLLND